MTMDWRRAQSFLTEPAFWITEHRQSQDELEGLQAAGRIGEESRIRIRKARTTS